MASLNILARARGWKRAEDPMELGVLRNNLLQRAAQSM